MQSPPRQLTYTLLFTKYRYAPQPTAEEYWDQFGFGKASVPGSFQVDALNALVADWIAATTLPTNRALHVLKRTEGGMCSADETRQIRFCPANDHQGSIAARVRDGEWSIEELVDLRDAFVKVMTQRLRQVSTSPERYHDGSVRENYNCRGRLIIE